MDYQEKLRQVAYIINEYHVKCSSGEKNALYATGYANQIIEFLEPKILKTVCRLCSSSNCVLIADIRQKPEGETDFGIRDYQRRVYQCHDCSVYFNVHDYIKPEFYAGRYNKASYNNIFNKYKEIRSLPFDKSDNKQRVQRVVGFIDCLELPHEQVQILDVGSGLCVFLGELKDRGFQCYCIDPDAVAIEHALQNVQVDGAYVGTLDNLGSEQKFDIISFNKVLEHTNKPLELLKKARGFLTSRGIVYIELPDGDGALVYGDAVDREEFYIEHFTIFNEESLEFLIQRAGFKCLEAKSICEPSGKFTIYGFLNIED